MWRKSVIRLPVTDAKYITKSSLFILLPGVIRQAGTEAQQRTKKPGIYSSARHIAKPLVACRRSNLF